MNVRLSVCIPVYNFGAFLGETLDSILPQATSEVEVLVVDGASTDDTAAVVALRMREWPQLRYHRLARRGGIDADMATSVELARGDYCWLFSGDDIMRAGAVQRVLSLVDAGDDVLLCRHSICDKAMRFLGDYPILRSDTQRRIEFAESSQRQEFLSAAVNTEALFSFMSGLVIRRQSWLSVPPVEAFMGSCWGHVARLLSLARHSLRVHYVGEVWLDKRGDNDSFMDQGAVHRFQIAVDGYVRLATTFYGAGSFEAAQVVRFLRNELTLASLMFARQAAATYPGVEDRRELDRMVQLLYGAPGLANFTTKLIYRNFPLWLYGLLRDGFRLVRPWIAWGSFISMR
jgi:abequosyltransferase